MIQRQSPDAPSRQRPIWLVTFTDLVALLIAFFVLLFATQAIDRTKWASFVASVNRTLDPGRIVPKKEPDAPRNLKPVSEPKDLDLGYLQRLLRAEETPNSVLQRLELARTRDRLVIKLPSDLLFTAGSAALTDRARDALHDLGGMLRNVGNRVAVHGHTDPRPVHGDVYRTNWELSLARAEAVAGALRAAGFQRDVRILGFADTRYAEILGIGSERRNELARRVDVVVHAETETSR